MADLNMSVWVGFSYSISSPGTGSLAARLSAGFPAIAVRFCPRGVRIRTPSGRLYTYSLETGAEVGPRVDTGSRIDAADLAKLRAAKEASRAA